MQRLPAVSSIQVSYFLCCCPSIHIQGAEKGSLVKVMFTGTWAVTNYDFISEAELLTDSLSGGNRKNKTKKTQQWLQCCLMWNEVTEPNSSLKNRHKLANGNQLRLLRVTGAPLSTELGSSLHFGEVVFTTASSVCMWELNATLCFCWQPAGAWRRGDLFAKRRETGKLQTNNILESFLGSGRRSSSEPGFPWCGLHRVGRYWGIH